jgi:hypothetical protein
VSRRRSKSTRAGAPPELTEAGQARATAINDREEGTKAEQQEREQEREERIEGREGEEG